MKKNLFFFITLLVVIVVGFTFIFDGINKNSRYNGVKVVKIEVKELKKDSAPILLLTLSDKKSIGAVLTSVNNATENKGNEKLTTFDQAGTSTHLLELQGKDNSKQKVYIALGPNNKGTSCYKETKQYRYTIDEKDTNNLRQIVFNK